MSLLLLATGLALVWKLAVILGSPGDPREAIAGPSLLLLVWTLVSTVYVLGRVIETIIGVFA
jgi:hypothetical protein